MCDFKANETAKEIARTSLSRTASLYGEEAVKKLASSHVAIFGIGGVGGHACEAIARSGIGEITIVDKDEVEESNINRQLVATYDTIGRSKVEVMEERIKSINPDCTVHAIKIFYGVSHDATRQASEDEPMQNKIDFSKFDYVIDAVDNITAKLSLIEECEKAGARLISSMGTAGKKDASAFKVSMLSKTSGDGLARVMRRECKKRGLGDVKVVYSEEESMEGSAPHVPPVAGLILAGEVINYLTK